MGPSYKRMSYNRINTVAAMVLYVPTDEEIAPLEARCNLLLRIG